jgi:hypothetical protein
MWDIVCLIITGESGSYINDNTLCNGVNNYEDYTASTYAVLSQNNAYTGYISSGGAAMAGRIWVDINDDYVFDSSECVGSIAGFNAALSPVVVTIPRLADTGLHRMRIAASYGGGVYGGGTYPNLSPCSVSRYGDVRDYTIRVQPFISFAGGSIQALSVCANSTGNNIDTLLEVNNLISGRTQGWYISAAPVHGILSGFSATVTTTGALVSPTGLTYTPTTAYVGDDQFTVRSGDGSQNIYTTIRVKVGTNSISGSSLVDTGAYITLSDATPGGTWSSSNAAIASVDATTGVVRGMSRGNATISYTVLDSCEQHTVHTGLCSCAIILLNGY